MRVQSNDGKVLRFWAVWDARDGLYGDRRPYVIHYYLADDTVEVLEVHETNSGRDPFPVFIARAPMPRPGMSQRGFTVAKRVNKAACYTPADLRIGAAVELHGRTMVLYACDAFTRTWYAQNMGYTAEELADLTIKEEARPCSHLWARVCLRSCMHACGARTGRPGRGGWRRVAAASWVASGAASCRCRSCRSR